MQLDTGFNNELTNKQLADFYSLLHSADWRSVEELQKSRQILGLIKSILKDRNDKNS